jgi:sugar lactone lactonase YvrE
LCQAPADTASEDLAFWPGRGLFLGSPGAILHLAGPGADLVELSLTGGQILNPVGIAFGASGDLFACENDSVSGTAVKRITPSGVCSTLSSGFQGTPFSLPNSIAIHGSGDLYLSVTCDGRIYRISSLTGSTSVFLSVPGPNGLAFNADDSYLYFTTEHAGLFCGQPGLPGGLYRVPLSPEGEAAGPIEALVEGFALAGDGLVFDSEGNLYVVFTVLGDGGLGALLTSAVFVYTEDGRFNQYFSVRLPGDILTNAEFGAEPFDPYSLYAYGFTGRVYRAEVGIQGLARP